MQRFLGTRGEVQHAIGRSHVTLYSLSHFSNSSTRLGVPALTFGGFWFDLFADLFWGTFVCSDEAAFRSNVVVTGKTLVWFRWLASLPDSTLKLSPALSIVEITRHARGSWQPCWFTVSSFVGLWRSILITPVRRVTPLRSFHMEKTHPTEAGYPDRLIG